MKIFVTMALPIFLVSCVQSPRELKSQKKDFTFTTKKNYEEVAHCIAPEYEERIRTGLLRSSLSSRIRILRQKKRAEIISGPDGNPIAVTTIYAQGNSTKIDLYMSSYQAHVYAEYIKRNMKTIIESCI